MVTDWLPPHPQVRSRWRHAGDGSYQLSVAGRNVTIYCHDMNGPEPLEYLTLPAGKHRHAHSNFAEIDPKRWALRTQMGSIWMYVP